MTVVEIPESPPAMRLGLDSAVRELQLGGLLPSLGRSTLESHERFSWERGNAMAKCALCGAETILFANGAPICVSCDKERSTQQPKQECKESESEEQERTTSR
jgi:hypothetical protein